LAAPEDRISEQNVQKFTLASRFGGSEFLDKMFRKSATFELASDTL
jgi:hypothetical protein